MGRVEDFLTSLAGIRGKRTPHYDDSTYAFQDGVSFLDRPSKGQLRPVSAQDLGTPHYGVYSRATTFWASSRRIQSLRRQHHAGC